MDEDQVQAISETIREVNDTMITWAKGVHRTLNKIVLMGDEYTKRHYQHALKYDRMIANGKKRNSKKARNRHDR